MIYIICKRVIDIIGALFGLLLSIPLLIIFGIFIKLDTPGPAFYKQERLGRFNKPFQIYKLRSMYLDAEIFGPQFACDRDRRVTPVGNIIRRTKIDEIPQFYNVLKGEMSLVGPRPERPCFTYLFNENIPDFIKRLKVKPGITGLAQINGGYNLDPRIKLAYDLEYIDKASACLDIKILLKTILLFPFFKSDDI